MRIENIHSQKGQSTVEMIVISLVLVPLMLIMPLLGKFLDISEATAAASRYMAFEATVHNTSSKDGWKSDAVLAQEVRRRFFSNPDAAVKTNDKAGNFDANRNVLWFDHRSSPLLPDFDKDITVKSEKDSYSQPLAAFASAFGLPKNNLYTGEVSVNIANVPGLAEFSDQTLAVTTKRHMTILVDSWAASGPENVKDRIDNQLVYPYLPLEAVNKAMTIPLTLFEYGASPPEIGRVDPDWVPADRVEKPY